MAKPRLHTEQPDTFDLDCFECEIQKETRENKLTHRTHLHGKCFGHRVLDSLLGHLDW